MLMAVDKEEKESWHFFPYPYPPKEGAVEEGKAQIQ